MKETARSCAYLPEYSTAEEMEVASKNSRSPRKKVQIYPDAKALEKLKGRLPKFQPHDVTSVLQLPADKAKKEADGVTSSVIGGQLDELLDALGIGRSTPDAWRRGFQLLAMIHHGTAHFIYDTPRLPSRGASKWTPQADQLLYEFVKEIKNDGVKPTVALRRIAKDAQKWRRLPLLSSTRLETSSTKLRYEALRKRWTRISKMAPPGSLLAAIAGSYPVNGSEKDKANWRPNLSELPPLASLGKSNAS